MTREWQSLKGPREFLQSEFSNCTDLNLISQVEFWSIGRRVFHHFGADVENSTVSQRSAELEQLSQEYDKWRQNWLNVLAPKHQNSAIHPRVFDLYFHSAKLHLYSHVFRGQSRAQLPPSNEKAENAFESALSIVRCAIDGHESGSWLERLPYYFGTMIAFASICFIRTSLQEGFVNDLMKSEGLDCLRRLAVVLRSSPKSDSATHPLLNIAKSLENATHSEPRPVDLQFDSANSIDFYESSFDFDLFATDTLNWSFPGDQWMMCPDDIDTSIF